MAPDPYTVSPELRDAMKQAMVDPLRARVYVAVFERPGATIAQLARRLDEPPGRIRRVVDRLIEAGLVVVHAETRRRNARERHHRSLVVPTVDEDGGDQWSEDLRGELIFSIMKTIAADIGRAIRHRTFGTGLGHCEIRVPGEVDERGWAEIGKIMVEAMRRAERTMIAAARRLEAAGRPGIEVISALLFFEAPPWEAGGEMREGPRPSSWAPSQCGSDRAAGEADGGHPPSDLRGALVEILADALRARVFITIAERPGATVGQIAARIGEPPRRVRHQVERLLGTGLVVIDPEAPGRSGRERHHRATVMPSVYAEMESDWTDEQRRKVALPILRMIMADLDGATRGRTLGVRPGYAVIRIPGEVDERGWEDLAAATVQTMEAIEAVMVASAARLEDTGRPGIEAISTLLLFEGSPWEPGGDDAGGPRPSHWRESRR